VSLENTLQVHVLLKRQLQAEVIGPIFAEMVRQLGEDKASAILDAAIRNAAVAEGKAFGAKAEGGAPSIADFVKLYELWTKNGSLEIEVLQQSDTQFDFNVTRCRYAETYKEMGLGKIGHLLSCNRDAGFCQGYDQNLHVPISPRGVRRSLPDACLDPT
jgi:L-2-amino-thiazoline-4-carboxylic acid hydrolase